MDVEEQFEDQIRSLKVEINQLRTQCSELDFASYMGSLSKPDAEKRERLLQLIQSKEKELQELTKNRTPLTSPRKEFFTPLRSPSRSPYIPVSKNTTDGNPSHSDKTKFVSPVISKPVLEMNTALRSSLDVTVDMHMDLEPMDTPNTNIHLNTQTNDKLDTSKARNTETNKKTEVNPEIIKNTSTDTNTGIINETNIKTQVNAESQLKDTSRYKETSTDTNTEMIKETTVKTQINTDIIKMDMNTENNAGILTEINAGILTEINTGILTETNADTCHPEINVDTQKNTNPDTNNYKNLDRDLTQNQYNNTSCNVDISSDTPNLIATAVNSRLQDFPHPQTPFKKEISTSEPPLEFLENPSVDSSNEEKERGKDEGVEEGMDSSFDSSSISFFKTEVRQLRSQVFSLQNQLKEAQTDAKQNFPNFCEQVKSNETAKKDYQYLEKKLNGEIKKLAHLVELQEKKIRSSDEEICRLRLTKGTLDMQVEDLVAENNKMKFQIEKEEKTCSDE
eukprot:TRINITY_DN6097_c0_g2_i1.p1 TRINITY_DN6097_c0_g2~~TRINITY_DN6097_c0_g2_i1.p1  ORF type:complete len:535 (+),score=119.16 TRINITY_DN6097_c0_g2_i1:83-1606(+)